MLIFGIRSTQHFHSSGTMHVCPRCGTAVVFFIELRRRFTFFFIPTFSCGTSYTLVCSGCGNTVKVTKEEFFTILGRSQAAANNGAQNADTVSQDNNMPQDAYPPSDTYVSPVGGEASGNIYLRPKSSGLHRGKQTAGLVLGIISSVWVLIWWIIFAATDGFGSEPMMFMILEFPAMLSVIGLALSIFATVKKCKAVPGIILNGITIAATIAAALVMFL